ncbi:hypothetical protein ACLI1X_16870, partial [Enterococcus faecalis]
MGPGVGPGRGGGPRMSGVGGAGGGWGRAGGGGGEGGLGVCLDSLLSECSVIVRRNILLENLNTQKIKNL